MGGEGAEIVSSAVLLYPHLNLIEGVWRILKGFLMPRRFYDSLAELKQAVLHGLRLLGAVEVQCQVGDTYMSPSGYEPATMEEVYGNVNENCPPI